MKKILIPIGSFYPCIAGGPSISMYSLVKNLSEKGGYSFLIFSTSVGLNKKLLGNIKQLQNVEVHYLNDTSLRFPLRVILKSIFSIRKCEIIHLNSVYDILSIIIFFSSLVLNKKIVWSVRGELYSKAINNNILKKIYLRFIYLFSKGVTFHITSEQEFRDLSYFKNNRKVKVVPNSIPYENNLIVKKKKQIVFLGRIVKHKNLENLINSFNLSDYKENEYKLLICGEGDNDYLSHLKSISDKSTSFRGYIDGIQKFKTLRESELLILPSKSENFGNVVLEAMSAGVMVLVTKNSPWVKFKNEPFLFITDNSIDNLLYNLDKISSLDLNVKIDNFKQSYEFFKSYNRKTIDLFNSLYEKL